MEGHPSHTLSWPSLVTPSAWRVHSRKWCEFFGGWGEEARSGSFADDALAPTHRHRHNLKKNTRRRWPATDPDAEITAAVGDGLVTTLQLSSVDSSQLYTGAVIVVVTNTVR